MIKRLSASIVLFWWIGHLVSAETFDYVIDGVRIAKSDRWAIISGIISGVGNAHWPLRISKAALANAVKAEGVLKLNKSAIRWGDEVVGGRLVSGSESDDILVLQENAPISFVIDGEIFYSDKEGKKLDKYDDVKVFGLINMTDEYGVRISLEVR